MFNFSVEREGNEFTTAAKICFFLVVAMSILFTLSVVIVTIVILCVTDDEHPNKLLRVWLGVFLGLWLVAAILNCIPTSTTTINGVVTSESGFANSSISSILQLACLAWWAVGLYWIISGGDKLKDGAPILFWYTAVILGLGAALGVICCCMFACICCCGTMVAGILMRASAAEPNDRV